MDDDGLDRGQQMNQKFSRTVHGNGMHHTSLKTKTTFTREAIQLSGVLLGEQLRKKYPINDAPIYSE
jgi:hypothetical protein